MTEAPNVILGGRPQEHEMTKRAHSLIWIALGLAAWLAQVTMPLLFVSPELLPLSGDELWREALWQLLPYAVLCSIAAFVSVPKVGNLFHGVALILTGGIGFAAWIDYANGGGCMRGLSLIMGYLAQCVVVTAGILLALIAKAVTHFQRRHARIA